MLNFEYFIREKKVKKKSVDKKFAKSLMKSSKDRFEFAVKIMNMKPRYALENAYEAIIELIDALLALKGYKSWSHEANIAFLKKFKEFSFVELERLDSIRKKRHSSKYYGVFFEKKEVEREMKFLKDLDRKLRNLIDRMMS
jgi:uncharacterized protein (UPF0332 family)